MSLQDVLRDTGLEDLSRTNSIALSPACRRHFHGGPDKRSAQQVITDLQLREGVMIELSIGGQYVIRCINHGRVYVHGLSKSINVYGIVKVHI